MQSSGSLGDKKIVGHDYKVISFVDYASGSGNDKNCINLEACSSGGILSCSTHANIIGVQCIRVIHVDKYRKKDSIIGTDMFFEVPVKIVSSSSLLGWRKRLSEEDDDFISAGVEKMPRRAP